MQFDDEHALKLEGLMHALLNVKSDVSLPQLVSLIAIGLKPGISVNELADLIDAPQQSASRYVSVLAGRYDGPPGVGVPDVLITQEISAADPRKRALYLSVEGRRLVQRMLSASQTEQPNVSR
jgi:DNA-binding MarR family transcriptional regulator